MNAKKYISVLLLFLSACAGNPWEASRVDEMFVTKITASGLKIFDYSLTSPDVQADAGRRQGNRSGKGSGSQGGGGGMGAGMGGTGGRKSGIDSGTKQYFSDRLEVHLEKTGYCREGYIKLGSYYERGVLKLRGECKEGATDEDRIKYARTDSV